MIWRCVVSEVTRGQSYHEIVSYWTIDDVDDCNCVIDAFEDVQARRAQADAERHRGRR